MELRSPASVEEAKRWLRAGETTIKTSANRAFQGDLSLDRAFELGHRRPDLVWAVFDGDRMHGVTAGRELPDGFRLLDIFAIGPAPSASLLIERATEWAGEGDAAEASFGAPIEGIQDPATDELVQMLKRAGWRLFVTRQHYEVAPESLPREGHPLRGRLERASADDEERLAELLQRVLEGSLDVRDREMLAKHGDASGEVFARELIAADPIEFAHFAVVDGRDAGVVVWRKLPDGRGYVAFVGVAADSRGMGLGRGMLSVATLSLLEEGATVLIADTDDANTPMRKAFESVGWRPSEARIDLTLR